MPANPNPNTTRRSYNPNTSCAYHSGQLGHNIENCFQLKAKIEELVDTKVVQFTDEVVGPNIARNPLPDHNVAMISAIFSDVEVNGIIVDEEPIILTVRRPVAKTTYVTIPAPPAYTSERRIP